jgi:hypothetical protein
MSRCLTLSFLWLAACGGNSGSEPRPDGDPAQRHVCADVLGSWRFLMDGDQYAELPAAPSLQVGCDLSFADGEFYLDGEIDDAGRWVGSGRTQAGMLIDFNGRFLTSRTFTGLWAASLDPEVEGRFTGEQVPDIVFGGCVAVPTNGNWSVTTSAFEGIAMGTMLVRGCELLLVDGPAVGGIEALQGLLEGREWAPDAAGTLGLFSELQIVFAADGTSFDGTGAHAIVGPVTIRGQWDNGVR